MNILTSDLTEAQRQMVTFFLDNQKELGLIDDEQQYEELKKQYEEQIAQGKPIMKVRKQEGQILSQPMNETFQECYIDFLTMFEQVNSIDNLAARHEQISQSSFRQLSNRVKAIRDTLTKYEEILRYRNISQMMLESFYTFENTERDNLYTDRFGNGIARGYRVHYRQEHDAIELPLVTQDDQLIQSNGLQMAKIRVGKQFGSGYTRLTNPETSVEKLLDTSKETYWSETILVDEPLEIEESALKDINSGTHYYYVRHGALCELIVEYDYPSIINEVELIPFSEFPMDVVAIKYIETVDGQEKEHYVVYDQAPNGLASKSSREAIRYQFPDIMTQKLVIVLNQRHYVKTDYHVPDKAKNEIMMWLTAPGEWKTREEDIYKPNYHNKIESEPAFVNFTRATSAPGGIDRILGVEGSGSPTLVQKYEYQYGLYELRTYKNEYNGVGIYVSPWITADTEVRRLSLDAVEEFPEVGEIPLCDIEYYISYQDSPEISDWYPIVPANRRVIEAELVTFREVGGSYRGDLRFTPKSVRGVRRNGVPLTLGTDYVSSGPTIELANFDRYSTYTVSYVPDESAYQIDFEELLELAKEKGTVNELVRSKRVEYRGTDADGVIELPYRPFVDQQEIFLQYDANSKWNPSFTGQSYVPIKVWMIDEQGYRIQQPQEEGDLQDVSQVWLMNKTNYLVPESQELEPFDKAKLNYQYSVIDGKLYFNTKIPSTTRIFVEFPYYVSGFYMKAILRRNHPGFTGLTPVLHEYRIYL